MTKRYDMETFGTIPLGTYRAACLVKNRKPLEVINITFPSVLASKQVLVKNLITSICGSQIGEIDGKKGKDPYLPHLLGHEAVSEVVAVASDVGNLRAGDRVVLHWMKGIGGESVSHSQNSQDRIINAGPVTTFSQYSIVSENRCTPIKTNLDLTNLPQFGCSWTTAYGSLRNDAQISEDDLLIVTGLGSIGMSTLEVSKVFNVKVRLGIDQIEKKVRYAHEIGFESLQWDFSGETPAAIMNLLNKNKQRRVVIIETTGVAEVINRAYEIIRKSGVLVLVGVTGYGKKIEIDPMPLHFGAEIKGSFGGACFPSTDIPYLIKLAEDRIFNAQALRTRSFSLDEINEAILEVRQGAIEKMLIDLRGTQ